MSDHRRLPAIAVGIELADFDTEIVALVPDQRRAVHLEAAHAVVLDSCRRGDHIDRVVDDLAQASGDDPATVATWVDDVVQEFARLGLVEPVTSPGSVAPDRS